MRLDIIHYIAPQMSSLACCGGFAVVVESASRLGTNKAGTRRGAGLSYEAARSWERHLQAGRCL